MKTKMITSSVIIFFVISLTVSCADVKTDNETIRDLKNSLISENYTSARYNAFSEKAFKEGYRQIGKLFKTLATAESVHARNFKKVLNLQGQNTDNIVPDFVVGSTEENLQNAIKEEIMDIDSIYPAYIYDSENSVNQQANKTFSLVWEAEKTHKHLLTLIYDVLVTRVIEENSVAISTAANRDNLPLVENLFLNTNYYVCPVDGSVYDSTDVIDKCSVCMTPRSKFITIKQ